MRFGHQREWGELMFRETRMRTKIPIFDPSNIPSLQNQSPNLGMKLNGDKGYLPHGYRRSLMDDDAHVLHAVRPPSAPYRRLNRRCSEWWRRQVCATGRQRAEHVAVAFQWSAVAPRTGTAAVPPWAQHEWPRARDSFEEMHVEFEHRSSIPKCTNLCRNFRCGWKHGNQYPDTYHSILWFYDTTMANRRIVIVS
jgi:hypothetical protein